MSYEIPKNLKYEEKFLFNLSLAQAGYIGLFATLGVIIILKTNLPIEITAPIALLFLGVGGGFAFFNLREHLTTASNFFLKPKELGYLSKEMETFTEVTKIFDDIMFLSNGTAKAIIQIQPINFHILNDRQQVAIITAYKDFLNSLDFPIQIVMRTVNLNLEDYLKTLETRVKKSKNPKIQTQYQDFKEFLLNYIENNAVKNRLFYIVIPTNEKNPKFIPSQLDIRVKLCQEKLKACNLTTKRLNTNELVSMLSSYFEGFIENTNQYLTTLTMLNQMEVKK